MAQEIKSRLVSEIRLESLDSQFTFLWGTFADLDNELESATGVSEKAWQINRNAAQKIVSFVKQRVDLWQKAQQEGLLKKAGAKEVYETGDEAIYVVDNHAINKEVGISSEDTRARVRILAGGQVVPTLELAEASMLVTLWQEDDQLDLVIGGTDAFIKELVRTTYYEDPKLDEVQRRKFRSARKEVLEFNFPPS